MYIEFNSACDDSIRKFNFYKKFKKLNQFIFFKLRTIYLILNKLFKFLLLLVKEEQDCLKYITFIINCIIKNTN